MIDSARGIRLGPEIFQLLGPEASQALSMLGFEGEVGPRAVELHYLNEEGQPEQLHLRSGEILLSDFTADGRYLFVNLQDNDGYMIFDTTLNKYVSMGGYGDKEMTMDPSDKDYFVNQKSSWGTSGVKFRQNH